MHSYAPSAETLQELYRFAMLLTGAPAAAEQAVVATMTQAVNQLGQFRSEKSQHQWLAGEVRRQCGLWNPAAQTPSADLPGANSDESGAGEAPDVAARFAALDEPVRTALALFYLELLSAQEIAQFLQIKIEQLSELLTTGRRQLQGFAESDPEEQAPSDAFDTGA